MRVASRPGAEQDYLIWIDLIDDRVHDLLEEYVR